MMTRRDFEMIAEVLRESRPGPGYNVALLSWELISVRFADRLQHTNPAFDRERFLRACRGQA